MDKKESKIKQGDIFMIPLFLPSCQMDEYTLDYSKYPFHSNDMYAFGRLIEIQAGNVDLIEVFSYTGQIPQSPECIIRSGRMFAPEHIGHPFSRKGVGKLYSAIRIMICGEIQIMKIFLFYLLLGICGREKKPSILQRRNASNWKKPEYLCGLCILV